MNDTEIDNRNATTQPVFVMPMSGYGDYNGYFNSIYDEAKGDLREKNPHWVDSEGNIKDEYQDDCISGSCEIAEKYTIEKIQSDGFRIVYPPDGKIIKDQIFLTTKQLTELIHAEGVRMYHHGIFITWKEE